jgi:hypothetical protein
MRKSTLAITALLSIFTVIPMISVVYGNTNSVQASCTCKDCDHCKGSKECKCHKDSAENKTSS